MTLNSCNAVAAEWSITPTLGFGGQYSDNIFLSATNPNNVTGNTITPEVKFNRINPNSAASIGARAQFTQYSDDNIDDADVQYLTFNSRYRAQQRSTWRINGTFRRDTTITTARNVDELIDNSVIDEITGEPIDIDIDTDTGLVEVEVRRNRLNLDPSWQYTLTERTSLQFGYRLLDVYYANAEGTDLVDYRRHSLDATLSRKLTQNDNLGMKIVLAQYKAPDTDTASDNYSLYTNYGHIFQQDLKGDISLGYRDTSTTTGAVDDNSGGVVLNIGINKKQTKLTSYNISLKRDINASGFGRVIQSDQINVRVNTRLTPRLSATLRANAFENNTLEGDITSVDRVYYSVEPSLRWLMTRDWAIDGSYRYRRQKRELDSDPADSNSIYVSLSYTWPKIAASR